MESLKNSAAELNWNQRTRRTSREVTEGVGGYGGKGDYTERIVLGQEGRRAGGLQGGELGEINGGRGRKSLDSRDRERQRQRRRQRRPGESICYNILGAREVDKVAGKLWD